MSEPSVSSLAIYQLRVVLCGVSPLVWRRLLVVNETSLGELHEILQNAFDWSGEHLHRFFAFALLPFYLLKQQRSGRNFTHAPLFPESPNFVQRNNGFWHTFMHQKRCFFANVLPSHSLRRRKYQVIDHHTALGLGMRCPGVTAKPHDSISSEPRSNVARSPMHRQSRFGITGRKTQEPCLT
jgi:hypothetical protein